MTMSWRDLGMTYQILWRSERGSVRLMRTPSLDPGRVAELHFPHLEAATEIVERIGVHALQRRRVHVQCHQVGIAGLQVRYLMNVGVLAAEQAAFGKVAGEERLDVAV